MVCGTRAGRSFSSWMNWRSDMGRSGVTLRTKFRKGQGKPAEWTQFVVDRVGDESSHMRKNYMFRDSETDKVLAELYISEDIIEDLGNPTQITITCRQGDVMTAELAIPEIAGEPVES